jgi:hypothetical protein
MLTQNAPSTTPKPAPVPMRSRFTKLVSSRNVEKIRREIEAQWGFMPTPAYCKALIKFVDEWNEAVAEANVQP